MSAALTALRRAEDNENKAEYYWVSAEAAAGRVVALISNFLFRSWQALEEADRGDESLAEAMLRTAEVIFERLTEEAEVLDTMVERAKAAELSARLDYEEAGELSTR